MLTQMFYRPIIKGSPIIKKELRPEHAIEEARYMLENKLTQQVYIRDERKKFYWILVLGHSHKILAMGIRKQVEFDAVYYTG